jgi:tRNA (guanine-N7-)-methyltransferase
MTNDADNKPYMRQVRSFILREGRLTPSQERAMAELWPKYGLDPSQALNIKDTFGRDADTVLEIGFGNGDSLADMAEASPEKNFIGIEVHTPGVGHLLLEIEKRGITNLRIYRHDAVEILKDCLADGVLTTLQLFFPDPWHKKRHHKRRIVQNAFADLVWQKLSDNGIWHIATDWEDYAEHCLEVLEPYKGFDNVAGEDKFIPRPDSRPITKFEKRGHRLGHGVWDIHYKKGAK